MGGWKALLGKDPQQALSWITEGIKAKQDAPRSVEPTTDERQRGALEPSNLQKALEGLHQDGLLVLKNVVDLQHVDHLREVMASETESILKDSPRAGQFNQGVSSNILQCPPVARSDCLYDDVWFNSFVIQIANA